MTYSEKRLAKQLQLEKDNIYLVIQMFKLAANKSEILIRLKAYFAKKPHNKSNTRNQFTLTV